MKFYVTLALTLISLNSYAGPFLVSDPLPTLTPPITHCGVYLDTAAKVVVPVALTAPTGPSICRYDLSGIASGNHTVNVTAIRIDPIWGTVESGNSSPLAFVRPGIPPAPSGLTLSP